MNLKQVKPIGFFAFTLAALLAFQNCLPTDVMPNKPLDSSRAVSGNGDGDGYGYGYGGKVTAYINRSATRCTDGSDVQAKIVVENDSGRTFLVRRDCGDVSPVELPRRDIGLMPHNPANVIYGDRVFDQETARPAFSSLLCRGQSKEFVSEPVPGSPMPDQINEVVDAVIRTETQDGGVRYLGRVILGIYDENGNLQKTYDMGEVKVSFTQNVLAGHLVYNSLTLHDHLSVFTLIVDEATWKADLTYHANIQAPDPARPQTPPPSEGFFTVSGLTCYRQ